MSLSHVLAFATSGLTANARRAELISSNVANAMTDGYGRRELSVSAETIGNAGAGVRIDGVVRHADPQLSAARRIAGAEAEYQATIQDAYSLIERSFGSTPDDPGLLQDFSRLMSAVIAAESDPASIPALDTLAHQLESLTGSLARSTEAMQAGRTDADRQIDRLVTGLSADLELVSTLNRSIQRAAFSGSETSSLMDQRAQVLDRIATVVPFHLLPREDGQVAIMSLGGIMLVDGPAVSLEFEAASLITAEMDATNGVPSPLIVSGRPFDLDGVDSRLGGGSLAAAFAMRDRIFVEGQARLDAFAADLLQRLEDPALDPSVAAGAAGLLTDNGVPFDPALQLGLAGRLELHPAVRPDSGGALWRLRDGLGAASEGPSGDGRLFTRLRSALSLGITGGQAHPNTAFDGLGQHAGRSASARLRAEDRQIAASAHFATLREAEAAKGVDTDYELQLLMQVEQAFAANAKVIEVADTLMQQLLRI